MKQRIGALSVLILMLLPALLYAQGGEQLRPLTVNPNQQQRGFLPAHKQLKNCNGGFIYLLDTFEITTGYWVDDFSSDLFKHYNAQPGDAGVEDTVFHALYIGGNLAPEDTSLHSDTTFYFTIDGTGVTATPLTSSSVVFWDICNYPPTQANVEAWPAYNVYDSTALGGTIDTVFFTGGYAQDSATYYIVEPDSAHWVDSYVYMNDTYPIDPPSIGVATFDGLDENGYPYDFSSENTYGEADFLTSAPINLNLNPNDSIYLSFFIQPEGLGNDPQPRDSFALEFKNANGNWDWIWSTTGDETLPFERIFVAIDSAKYLYKGFQFRFRNYATLSGNLDHWHLDYVELGRNRSVFDPINDVAYVYPINTLLELYTTMPWTHYQSAPASFMRDSMSITMQNLSNNDVILPHFLEVDYQGSNIYSVNSNTTPIVVAGTQEQDYQWVQHINNYEYDANIADTCATFEVRMRYNPVGRSTNDEITVEQTFWNQYGYDDGSAEAGYGLLGNASKLAHRFTSQIADTVNGAYVYFNPILEDVSDESFNLMVWAADGPGGEPGTVLSQNQFTFSRPEYNGTNRFQRIELETPVVVNGNFYIGFLQQTDVFLNVGFDYNTDASDKIMFNVAGSWQNTSFNGSLMLRPSFTTEKDYILPVEQEDPLVDLVMYPNPNNGVLHFKGLPADAIVEVFDVQGRTMVAPAALNSTTLSLEHLETGTYLVRVITADEQSVVTRMISLQR